MATVASSSSAPPPPQSSVLALRDFTVAKIGSALNSDTDGADYASRKVNGPQWLSDSYGQLIREVRHMGETIRTLRNEGQDPHQVIPHLVAAYQVALQYQHYIIEQNNEALQRAQREDYLRIVAASTQLGLHGRGGVSGLRGPRALGALGRAGK